MEAEYCKAFDMHYLRCVHDGHSIGHSNGRTGDRRRPNEGIVFLQDIFIFTHIYLCIR